ncbi:hypothetical protein CK516_00970 [Nostoc sp. 'Peltigera malacea cyanobiont' DB3992]|nr:hypothetical protein CK516_00970 [Nostoc sp. 'Peltigera malacea cyanobiont' DB3992]
MLLTGILLGAGLGIILGLVPSFNIGFAYLFATTLKDPYFAVGLIIGVDSTSSIMRHLSMINSASEEDASELYKHDTSLILTSLASGMSGKFIGSAVGIGLLIFLQGSEMKLDGLGRAMSVIMVVGIWSLLIVFKSKNYKLAIASLVASSLLALVTTNLPINQPMFVLASCMFSSTLFKSVLEKQGKIKDPHITSFHEGIEIASGFFAGALSSILWGLPTSVVCKAMQEDHDKPHTIISRKAFADSVSSSLGLTIFLVISRSKSALTSNLSSLHLKFNDVENVGIILVSLSLSLVGYLIFNNIMDLYIKVSNVIPGMINKLIPLLTIGTLVYMSNGWCIPLIGASLLLNKVIRLAEAPKELNLGALSILPMMALF